MKGTFPFSAVVGQEEAKLALRLCLIDPSIGGVLLLGQKGSAKSVLARGAARLLPELPFLTLPLGVSEDNLLGHTDLRRLLHTGERAFEPGLLARARGGALYIDEINLLPPTMAALLLDASASGVLRIEREGHSSSQPCDFSILGSMNPEEGGLGPQLLDRLGLAVRLGGITGTDDRTELLRRVLAWNRNPDTFGAAWEAAEAKETESLRTARDRLMTVSWTPGLADRAAALAAAWACQGSRGELALLRAARALAAYRGGDHVRLEDIEAIAPLALDHRRSSAAAEAATKGRDLAQEGTASADRPEPNGEESKRLSEGSLDRESPQTRIAPRSRVERGPEVPELAETADHAAEGAEGASTCEAPERLSFGIEADDETGRQRRRPGLCPGKRAIAVDGEGRGRSVRAIRPRDGRGSLDIGASIRASLLRRPSLPARLGPEDIRIHQRERGIGEELLFVVDASGSMAAHRRMAFVKGALEDMLEDSYRKRDSVAVIVFRNACAELVIPPTRSLYKAYTALSTLRTGGKTPLEEALKKTAVHIMGRHAKEPGSRTRVVLVSDGRIASAAEAACLATARRMASLPARFMVIDSERGWVRAGSARRLAEALSAEYRRLEDYI